MSDRLAPCPDSPNCVCSRAGASPRHRIEPLVAGSAPAATFERLKERMAAAPRIVVVTATHDYLHVVCRTRLGFADDLECHLVGDVIHVRSASRLGYYDFGANRARVEALRRQLSDG